MGTPAVAPSADFEARLKLARDLADVMTAHGLCRHFLVDCFEITDEFLRGGWPPEARGKFMVSVLDSLFVGEDVSGIPLANSEEEAEAIAVKYLKLRERYAKQMAQNDNFPLSYQ